MAYNIRYKIIFRNRQQSQGIFDTYRLNILQKDYTGNITDLMGATNPFVLKYANSEERPPFIIRASECEINFFNDGLTPLSSFYSEDDEEYRFDFYSDTIEGVAVNKLLWSGFMVQDDCQEEFKDPAYEVSLKGTDNLGLLKEISFDKAFAAYPLIRTLYSQFTTNTSVTFLNNISIDVPIIIVIMDVAPGDILNINGVDYTVAAASFDGDFLQVSIVEVFPANGTFADQQITIYKVAKIIDKLRLFDYVAICLNQTGIALPFNIYSNIFENTQDDRGDNATAEMFSQTRLFSGEFQDDDGTWENCYDILEKILFALNSTIFQAEGYWNIVRVGETSLFTDNAIPGTQYTADFLTASTTTLDPNVLIDKDESGSPLIFLNNDTIRRISRPFKNVKFTFNYHQPKSLIIGNDLETLGAFISTSTEGDLRYDDYEIPSAWTHTHNDNSFIRIVTDISTDLPTEVDRYIVTPGAENEQRGIQFNPIDVTKGDVMDFSVQFKMTEANTDTLRFWIRLILVTAGGQYYLLSDVIGSEEIKWTGPFGVSFWDDGLGFYYEIEASADKTGYTQWDMKSIATGEPKLPTIPEDGVLLIEVRGTNGSDNSNRQTTVWSQINLEITNRINDNINVIGQYHLQEQDNNIKNVFDEEIFIDDSPRNTIAGTLFTNAKTTFGANIGDIYFTRTNLWHRKDNDEELRLGQITTLERKMLAFIPRTILEGTFFGVRYTKDSTNRFVSLLSVFQVGALEDLNLILGPVSFNYMDATFNGTLYELYKNAETSSFDYTFKYILKTT